MQMIREVSSVLGRKNENSRQEGCCWHCLLGGYSFLPSSSEFLSKHDVDEGLDENLRIKPP
jgi:hypothetical protein